MKRAKLTITVDYDDNPDNAAIDDLLRNVARLAAGNGMLSGDGEATVESWDCDVTIGEQDDPVRTALTDLVDSYDDTGCEDCGVVDEAAYEAGRKALGLVDETEAAPTGDTVRGVWARFRPQAYINDNAVDIDGGFMFDVTMQIEQMGREKALEITDHSYSADDLWHAYVASRPEKEHDGPFEVEVEDAIEKFYEPND